MRLRVVSLFSCLLLAACASEDSRYRDTSALEKPPTLVVEKRETVPEAPEKDAADKPAEAEAAAVSDEDQEETDLKTQKGLGDLVTIDDKTPPMLTIKQSFDVAWNSLKRALIQSDIEVTDLEHDKGKFYVSYDADSYVSEHGSLIEKSVGLFSNEYAKQGYLLTLTAEGSATQVTAAPLKDAEYRKRTDHDDEAAPADSDVAEKEQPADGADKLLRSIYLTLKDDLREK